MRRVLGWLGRGGATETAQIAYLPKGIGDKAGKEMVCCTKSLFVLLAEHSEVEGRREEIRVLQQRSGVCLVRMKEGQ